MWKRLTSQFEQAAEENQYQLIQRFFYCCLGVSSVWTTQRFLQVFDLSKENGRTLMIEGKTLQMLKFYDGNTIVNTHWIINKNRILHKERNASFF